jgi:hypothetical protein
MTIVWSLPGGDYHPIRLKIFTKFYSGAGAWLQVKATVSAILFYSNRERCLRSMFVIRARKAEMAQAGTKMKLRARVMRTIA